MANGNGGGNGNGKKGKVKPRRNPNAGRNTLCTKKLTEEFAAVIRSGATARAASRVTGVCESTAAEWMMKGRAPKGAPCYRAFVAAVEKAKGYREVKANKIITDAIAAGDVSAAKWHLSIWDPETYSQQYKLKVAGDPDNPLEVNVRGAVQLAVTPEHLAEVCRILAEAEGESDGNGGEGGQP